MWETFTQTLRHVLDDAQLEARALNQEFVSTEHLVLAVLDREGSEAHRAMELAGLAPDDLRNILLRELPLGDGDSNVEGSLPFSPKAQRIINAALMTARLRRQPRVTTRGVLGALLEEPDTLVRQAMVDCGTDVELVAHLLNEPSAEAEE